MSQCVTNKKREKGSGGAHNKSDPAWLTLTEGREREKHTPSTPVRDDSAEAGDLLSIRQVVFALKVCLFHFIFFYLFFFARRQKEERREERGDTCFSKFSAQN